MKDLYFSHDRNALSDNKISELRGIYGMEGYGVFWALLEAMSRTAKLELERSDRCIGGLTISIQPSFDLTKFVDDCIEIGLFSASDKKFWSESLKRRTRSAEEKTRTAQNNANARWKGRKGEKDEPADEPYDSVVLSDLIDPEYKRVTDAYQTQIGALPMGLSEQKLMSYVEDLGADAVIVAIEETNAAQPARPFAYLKKVLEEYAAQGIRSGEAAQARRIEHDRTKKSARSASAEPAAQKRDEPPVEFVR